MRQEDLQRVGPGFDDPTLGSQAVFRLVLQALSLPGRAVELPPVAQLPAQGQPAAAMLMLALLDSDCTLWLSESLAGSDAEAWLRFHTGCRVVREPGEARFLWLAAGDHWPALAEMDAGNDEYPDQSATCVMEVLHMWGATGEQFTLRGPGIAGEQTLHVAGLPADFADQWADNHGGFPRGVDVLLCAGAHMVGLPRSTRVKTMAEA
jgi:alpha-D-ribose 1-methylphosphonate 5-triphosphate synthase subunit PhnH